MSTPREPSYLNPRLPESLKQQFLQKLKTPEEAVQLIRSGDRIYIGSNCGEPETLAEALCNRKDDLFGCEVTHLLTHGIAPYVEPEYAENFRVRNLFIGANMRKAVNEGRADFVPIFLSEIPRLFRNGQLPIDVAMVSVTPPDEHGYCSMGVAVDIGMAACEVARVILAEVKPDMPRTLGNGFLHINDIDAFCTARYPVIEHSFEGSDETSAKIAEYIVDLIDDGACIQAGIGNIPDAVLARLGEKNDLGMHTEMFSDGIIPLIQNGNINCRKKTLHPGKVVATFVIGTRKLYEYIDNNPFFEFRTSDYVNDPFVVAQNDNMIAINSCIEVDLTGQVVSDSIGNRFYSGFGGQVDFIRGAARSKGGKPIIALPSTAKGGTISKIVPMIKPAAGVTTSRGDVHYVVTEYGVAYLHGRSVRERALSLIRIAHPNFRDELLEKAKELGYVSKEQPSVEHRYPSELIRTVTLRDGTEVTIRPILPTDEYLLKRHFYSLSEESVRKRFGAVLKSLSNATFRELVNPDYKTHMAFVATVKEGQGEVIITTGRYYINQTTNYAEFAMATRDDWQGRGVGTEVFKTLVETAQANKVLGFTATILAENTEMMKIIRESGLDVESKLSAGQYEVKIHFRKRREGLESS